MLVVEKSYLGWDKKLEYYNYKASELELELFFQKDNQDLDTLNDNTWISVRNKFLNGINIQMKDLDLFFKYCEVPTKRYTDY